MGAMSAIDRTTPTRFIGCELNAIERTSSTQRDEETPNKHLNYQNTDLRATDEPPMDVRGSTTKEQDSESNTRKIQRFAFDLSGL